MAAVLVDMSIFSFFADPSYPRAALGIERERITAVGLRSEGRGRFEVNQGATIELPPNLVEPSFLERNIADAAEFRQIVEETLISAGLLGQKEWSVSLPSNSARTAILTLESAAAGKGNLEAILDWKAEQTFGAPATELRISRKKVAGDGSGRIRYFATAVKLTVIDEYESALEQLGLRAGLVLPRAVSESRWLGNGGMPIDSLLISAQDGGFTALLLRSGEPTVVRTVSCSDSERDDEVYRLLMFYKDRFTGDNEGGTLDQMLTVGNGLLPAKIKEISIEALGSPVKLLTADDVGLRLPPGGLVFDDLAAPAGLATLGWR